MTEALKISIAAALLAGAALSARAADKPEVDPATMPAVPLAIRLSEQDQSKPVPVGISHAGGKVAVQPAGLAPDAAAAVQAWAAAWSRRDVEAYLAAYADDFRPEDGASHAQWVEARRARIGKAQHISVQLEKLRGEKTPGGVRAHFRQHYAADNFHDVTDKTLELQQQSGGWKITREIAR